MQLIKLLTWAMWSVLLIPASDQTAGHGTTAQARFWKRDLAEVLQSAARRGK